MTVIHSYYVWDCKHLVCREIVNVPINCVQNIVFRLSITRYFVRVKD